MTTELSDDYQGYLPVDILAILASRIREYNVWHQEPVHSIFVEPRRERRSLKELLRSDIIELAELNPEIEGILPYISIVESEEKLPGACSTHIRDEGLWEISVNRKLIHLIHAFHGVSFLLTRHNKTDDLLPKYRDIVCSDAWDDHRLWAALITDIETFYDSETFISLKTLGFQFLHAPYEYCYAVIIARKFIVAHELAHIILGHHTFLNIDGSKTTIEQKRQHEYEADELGLKMVFREFEKENLSNMELWLLDGAVFGIFAIFGMLHYSETLLNWYAEDHPHPLPYPRSIHALKFINNHPSSNREARHVNFGILSRLESFNALLYNPMSSFLSPSARQISFGEWCADFRRKFNVFGYRNKNYTAAEIRLITQFYLRKLCSDKDTLNFVVRKIGFSKLELNPSLSCQIPNPNLEWTNSPSRCIDEILKASGADEDIIDYSLGLPGGILTIYLLLNSKVNIMRLNAFIELVSLESQGLKAHDDTEAYLKKLADREDRIVEIISAHISKTTSHNLIIERIYREESTSEHDRLAFWN